MEKLKIALLQIAPLQTLEDNLSKGIACCKKAKELGADIILFPEMYSNGYKIHHRPIEDWMNEAIEIDSKFVTSFKELAKSLNVAIGITFLEKYKNNPRNTLILFDRFGNQKIHYSKVHTCDFDVERNLTAGKTFYVTNLDTEIGSVKVGAMICYDREFPESARVLMLKGAEVVLVPNACPMEINRLSQLRTRAYENMFVIATCNYPNTVPDCNGGSTVFDGVAYLEGISGSRDMCLLHADGEENIHLVEIDLEMVRKYRLEEVHGNCYRHPNKYKILISKKRKHPFVRKDYRK